MDGSVGVNIWEYAYYLQYLNGKGAYVNAISMINRETVGDSLA